MSHVKLQSLISGPLAEVFQKLTLPQHLEDSLKPLIQVKWLNEGIEPQVGSEFLFSMSRFGVSQEIRFRVEQNVPGHSFTYSQVEGFLNSWRHSLKFEPTELGVRVTEFVEYEVPFGLVGKLVEDFWWKKDLNQLLNHRAQWASELLSAKSTPKLLQA